MNVHSTAMLIDSSTGKRLKVGDTVKTFRDEPVEIMAFSDASMRRNIASSGRVRVRFVETGREGEFYPGVIGAKIIH